MSAFRARLQLLAAAFLFSTGGMAVKATDFTNWQVAGLRSGLAAVVLLLFLPRARQRWTWRAAVVGLAYAATLILFVSANKTTTAANAIFLQATAPIYIVFLAPWLLGERATRRDLGLLAVVAIAFAMIALGHQEASASAPDPGLGNLLAGFAGLTWALTVVGIRWLENRRHDSASGSSDAPVAVVLGNLYVFVGCAPLAFPVGAAEPTDWLWLAFLGIFQVGLAYVLLTTAMGSVPALEASLLLLVEPVFNPLWAFLVHGEQPGPWTSLGGVVLVVGTAAKAWLDARHRRRERREQQERQAS